MEVPLLARIFTTVTWQIRSGSTARKEIRTKTEQRLDDLINRLTLLTDNVTEQARRKGFKGLVVIVDSMEKMHVKILDKHELTNDVMLFIEHAEQLKAFPCHMIATVPISLLSNCNMGMAFTDIDLIPMVKVVSPNGSPSAEGRDLLFRTVSLRAVIDNLFADSEVV